MALDIDKIRSQFENLEKKGLKDFSLAVLKKDFAHLEACYAACLKLEGELEETLPGARKRGINGSDAKAFQRDAIFKKKYKEYDSSVDDIDKAEKKCYTQTISAGALSADLGLLRKALDKAYPKSKDTAVLLLAKKIDMKIKEMDTATDLYDPRGKHKKMREYSTKFDKKVEAILDHAPPAENPEEFELPKELDPKETDKAKKNAENMQKAIVMASKNIRAIIKVTDPFTIKADADAKRHEKIIDITVPKLTKYVKHYELLIKKSKPKEKPPRGNGAEAVESIEEFEAALKQIDEDMTKLQTMISKELQNVRKTLG